MGENRHQTSSKLGLKNAGGEIVEVQGGHIVRSTGRKDRHSKVCTSKGPRDRRVRLSAHTAIQFYDVQDRLGFDRPSKAVDWLIKKAKAAIDELAELPAWHPTATTLNTVTQGQEEEEEEENRRLQLHRRQIAGTETVAGSGYAFEQHLNNSSSFLPPSLDSDSIADTIKSFFPMTAATQTPSIHFQNQNYSPELLSRSNSHAQDLRLSLQSFQDPMLLHHSTSTPSEQTLFSGSTPLTFDSNSGNWSEQQQQLPEMDRFQRMVAWNSGAEQASGGGFFFNSPPLLLQPLLGQNQLFFQRGPLQSSNSPSVRAWTDSPIAITDHLQTPPIYPSSISGFGFASGGGFRIPARIQGEEEQDAISNKQSSASSASRH